MLLMMFMLRFLLQPMQTLVEALRIEMALMLNNSDTGGGIHNEFFLHKAYSKKNKTGHRKADITTAYFPQYIEYIIYRIVIACLQKSQRTFYTRMNSYQCLPYIELIQINFYG